jgi:hypothetical protein
MSDPTDPGASARLMAVTRAIRFALVAILLGLCYLNIRSALSIHAFERIFVDMLGGKALPALTLLVIQLATPITLFSLAMPFCAIATLFMRDLVKPFYVLGMLALIAFAEIAVLYLALFAPLTMIMRAL